MPTINYHDNRSRTDTAYSDLQFFRTGRRYRAVNLQNPSTIEFRLFKGTLKPDIFYATIALVDGIVRWCKQHTTPEVHTLTWDGLLAWINDDTLTAYWNTRKQYLHRFTAYAA